MLVNDRKQKKKKTVIASFESAELCQGVNSAFPYSWHHVPQFTFHLNDRVGGDIDRNPSKPIKTSKWYKLQSCNWTSIVDKSRASFFWRVCGGRPGPIAFAHLEEFNLFLRGDSSARVIFHVRWACSWSECRMDKSVNDKTRHHGLSTTDFQIHLEQQLLSLLCNEALAAFHWILQPLHLLPSHFYSQDFFLDKNS